MILTDRTGPRWRAQLEGYDDLITLRAAGEYEFIDDRGDVWVDPDALAAVGVIDERAVRSEGWAALGADRRYYGVELKRSYYDTACRNLVKREREIGQRMSLFDDVPA